MCWASLPIVIKWHVHYILDKYKSQKSATLPLIELCTFIVNACHVLHLYLTLRCGVFLQIRAQHKARVECKIWIYKNTPSKVLIQGKDLVEF